MSSEAENAEEERSLREAVARSERDLEKLEKELGAIDSELQALAAKQQQYLVLGRVCESLEELDGLGASGLFWDGPAGAGSSDPYAQLRYARERIDRFAAEIDAIEERRQGLADRIGKKNETLDYLHVDLHEAMEREDRRRSEWIVEREPDLPAHRTQIMPWTRGCEEDQRFRVSLGASMASTIALAMLISTIALPLVERSKTADELPERVAKLVRRERRPPPPPVPVEEPLIAQEPEPEPEPQITEDLPPEPAVRTTKNEAGQAEPPEPVRAKGILAFRDSFANRADLRPGPQLGSQARVGNAGENSVGRPQRMMVSKSAPGSSGGINIASISRDVGGGGTAIEGVEVTRVASSIGTGDGPDRPLAGGASAGRTDEEIQIVFDRYKASLYRLYNRELRKDPTLRGQLVLRLTIEPDGSVSMCQLQTSNMDAPALASQVVERVSAFDFGAKEDIVAITIIYPIDFLPAA